MAEDTALEEKKEIVKKKSEKITAALYKVTSFVDDADPLRAELRRCAVCVLKETLALFSGGYKRQDIAAAGVYRELSFIDSLLETSIYAEICRRQNLELLRDEYLALSDFIYDIFGQKIASRESAMTLLEAPPGGASRKKIPTVEDLQRDILGIDISDLDKGQKQDLTFKKEAGKQHKDAKRKGTGFLTGGRKKTTKKAGKSLLQTTYAKEKEDNSEKKKHRREQLISFIKDKGRVNLKDIMSAPHISKGFSGKTMQRELARLVQKGDVLKEGERRWSTYRAA